MHELRFEWDAHKEAGNRRKHGVSFDEAASVFSDDRGRLLEDPDHSSAEERFVLLGLSFSLRVLVVCHSYRRADSVIRVISARKATRAERREYDREWSK